MTKNMVKPLNPMRGGASGRPAGLTERQRGFVGSFIQCRDGVSAAITAGYSRATASQAATRLLKHVQVKAAIEQGSETITAKAAMAAGITLQRTLKEISEVAYCPLEDIRGMGLDKTRALDMLMKHLGGYEANNAQAGQAAATALAGLAVRFVESKG